MVGVGDITTTLKQIFTTGFFDIKSFTIIQIGQNIGNIFGIKIGDMIHLSTGTRIGQTINQSVLSKVGAFIEEVIGGIIGDVIINHIANNVFWKDIETEDKIKDEVKGDIPTWIIDLFRWFFVR